ncbi:angio-associated migratory cell protein [Phtheirospermum japonicum]|uniref:Angio-associated migratory cell protein n=1 Tax=Phtheirospermum japonicum TaxID=374723 RepID=A0A830D8P0_9LAMI|nr:angio-associated migratory cell protein [Phtheirospermum japonicum]
MKAGHVYLDDSDEDEGDVYIDDCDIVQEIDLNEEDLPDASDDDVIDSSDESDRQIADANDDSVQKFVGHTGEVYSVACSPVNAALVATGGQDDKGFVWNIGGNWVTEVKGDHRESVSCLAFSSYGHLLASGDVNGLLHIWDHLGNQKQRFDIGAELEWVKWHPSGHLVLAGSADHNVYMWDADEGTLHQTFSGHGKSVTCGDFTPDGNIVCTGSEDGTLRIWDPASGRRIHVVKGDEFPLICLAMKADSTLALTGTAGGFVHVSNIKTGKVVSSLSVHEGPVNCVGISPSIPWGATGGADGKLIIWDMERLAPRSECIHEEQKGVKCLAWIGASRVVAAGCKGGKILLWDCLSGECFRVLRGHSRTIESLSVSADQSFLVSASRDGTARVFDLRR